MECNNDYKKAKKKIEEDSKCKSNIQYIIMTPSENTIINSILTGYDGIQVISGGGISNLDLGIEVNKTGTALSFQSPDSIIINKKGSYLINFSSIISNAGTVGDLGVSMCINGNVIPTASEYIPNQGAYFSSELQHNYNASAGDIITFINVSPVSNSYHDITVSVLKLA